MTAVDEGSQLMTQSGRTPEQIVTAVKKVSDIIGEIASARHEQSTGIEQVNKAVMQLGEMTQQNAALVEQASAASHSVASQAAALNTMMSRYKVSKEAAAAALSASLPSDATPHFGHIQRFWDPLTAHWTAKILPGEYYVTTRPESIATVVGSCVTACLRDTRSGIGGMNHFMLPEDRSAGTGIWSSMDGSESMRFGTQAMATLLGDLFKLGAHRENLELKLFGGGRVTHSTMDVGARNIAFARCYAAAEGLRVSAEDLGGVVPRHVLFFPESGRVLLKRLRAMLDPAVVAGEIKYQAARISRSCENELELFD